MIAPLNRDLHLISAVTTAVIAGVLGLLLAGVGAGWTGDDAKEKPLGDAVRIEAALAYKKADPKKKQPQKRKKQKVKPPEGQKVSRDEKKAPAPKEKKPRVEPDEIDPMSILEKNRKLQDDDTASDTGTVELDEGAIFGSEWGSGDKNIGDPYIGGLRSRIQRTFEAEAPGFIEAGKTVWGCVKLNTDGTISAADGEVPEQGRSDSAALNSAMEQTLKKLPEMDGPVPAHLVKLLTERGVCFRLKTK